MDNSNNIKIKNNLSTNLSLSLVPQVSNNTPTVIAKADSGASRHYFRKCDQHVLTNLNEDITTSVQLPNNATINSTTSGTLPITDVKNESRLTHVFDDLRSASLISLEIFTCI